MVRSPRHRADLAVEHGRTRRTGSGAYPLLRGAVVLLTACAPLAGCTDEDVTGTGRELVAGGVVRTSEIVLSADAFLVADTSLGGFSDLNTAVTLLALDVGAGLEARGALRFGAAPISIDVATDSTTIVQDTLATLVGGRLQLVIDTLAPASPDSVRLLVEAIQEAWDPATATWENRVDSAFSTVPWSSPGGGARVPVDSVVWTQGTDSISFTVDSATAAAWTDVSEPGRGTLVSAATDGAQLELNTAILWLSYRPSVLPDTVIEVGVNLNARTTLLTEPAPPADLLLIGGAPARRAFLRFAPGLDTLPVPCPEAGVDCGLTLADADLTFVSLELTAAPAPGLPVIVRPASLTARAVTPDPRFPLERAPLRFTAGSTVVEADTLAGGVLDPSIALDVTAFTRGLVEGSEEVGDLLAIATLSEGFRFGTIGVRPLAHPDGPRLRLVITVASPQEIR
ncbi:MAG TPA: hypothetical protein VK837_09315 [Longimicrobiales bacterium]|nr:hypothetical protein [Longimicrobiales bacterium]